MTWRQWNAAKRTIDGVASRSQMPPLAPSAAERASIPALGKVNTKLTLYRSRWPAGRPFRALAWPPLGSAVPPERWRRSDPPRRGRLARIAANGRGGGWESIARGPQKSTKSSLRCPGHEGAGTMAVALAALAAKRK